MTEQEMTLRKALNAIRLEVPAVVADDFASIVWKALVSAERETAKAFGGCHLCYGKGYSTIWAGTTGSADFHGDKDVSVPPNDTVKYCNCDRGKRLEELSKKGVL